MKWGVVTVLLVGLVTTPVLAAPTVLVDRSGAFWNASLGGGQFNVTPNAELMAISGETGNFLSFCVENRTDLPLSEEIFASVQSDAFTGNGNTGPLGPNGGDPLDTRTAYLYRQYRDGVITVNDNIQAGVFQQAIWVIEEELDPFSVGSAVTDLVDDATANADGSLYGIQVLHLWQINPDHPDKPEQIQDLLIDASGACPVPAPGAFVLGSLGLGLVRCFRRRRDS